MKGSVLNLKSHNLAAKHIRKISRTFFFSRTLNEKLPMHSHTVGGLLIINRSIRENISKNTGIPWRYCKVSSKPPQ